MERDNLLLSGSWFDLLGKAFDVFHRGIFSDCEYNVDMTLRKHRFLYLDDLDDDARWSLSEDMLTKRPSERYL